MLIRSNRVTNDLRMVCTYKACRNRKTINNVTKQSMDFEKHAGHKLKNYPIAVLINKS